MIKTIARVSVVVLILSLVALAANKGPIKLTTTAKPGGIANKQLGANKRGPVIFNNMALDNAKGLYFCCSGWELTGPDWEYSQYGYQWIGLQFTLNKAKTVNQITTSVTYFQAATFTDFLLSIQADSNGVPSGTPLGSGPWTVSMDSQSFGQCCTTEAAQISGGLQLNPGTYWVVWSTESNSDLYAGINDEVRDAVDAHTIAYYYSSGSTWYSYTSTDAPAIEIQ